MSQTRKIQKVVLAYSGGLDTSVILKWIVETYGCEVAAVLPHSEELMALAGGGLFALRYPADPLTALYRKVAERLVD